MQCKALPRPDPPVQCDAIPSNADPDRTAMQTPIHRKPHTNPMQCNPPMQCNAMQCNATPPKECNAMQPPQCNAIECNPPVQCNAMQCNEMQCNGTPNATETLLQSKPQRKATLPVCNAKQSKAKQSNPSLQCNAKQNPLATEHPMGCKVQQAARQLLLQTQ